MSDDDNHHHHENDEKDVNKKKEQSGGGDGDGGGSKKRKAAQLADRGERSSSDHKDEVEQLKKALEKLRREKDEEIAAMRVQIDRLQADVILYSSQVQSKIHLLRCKEQERALMLGMIDVKEQEIQVLQAQAAQGAVCSKCNHVVAKPTTPPPAPPVVALPPPPPPPLTTTWRSVAIPGPFTAALNAPKRHSSVAAAQKASGNEKGPYSCNRDGCFKRARGGSGFCIGHGGGRRCKYPGCTVGAIGSGDLCTRHGGGKRCQFDGCDKGAKGGTPYCVRHGGDAGNRCTVEKCDRKRKAGSSFCESHGGSNGGMIICRIRGCQAKVMSEHIKSRMCPHHLSGVRPTVEGRRKCQVEACMGMVYGDAAEMFCKNHGGRTGCSVEDCDEAVENKGDSLCIEHKVVDC